MCVRKTTEEFRKEVNNLGRGEYLLCSAYKNSHTKVKMYHKNCGNYYDVEPTAFLQGTRCPYCFGTHKLSQKDFISLVRDQVGNDYTFMEPYVNNHTKLLIKHNKCGYIWKVTPNKFLYKKTRCPNCAKKLIIKKNTIPIFDIKDNLINLVGTSYHIFSYHNKNTNAVYFHIDCGHFFKMRPRDFENGQRCPYCAEILRHIHKTKTDEEYQKEVCGYWGNTIIPLESYKGSSTKIKHKCAKCGFIWKSIPTSILGGFGCPRCKYSKGELNICNVLDSLKIEYETPKKFRGLKSFKTGYPLRYDFYLPRYKLLIEYQGIQHYKANKFFGGSRVYQYQVEKDYNKAYYAFDHGYRFLSIKYSSLGNIRNIIKSAIQSECRLLLNQ